MPGMNALNYVEQAALERMHYFRNLSASFRLRAALSWAAVSVASAIDTVLDDELPSHRALRADLADRKAEAYHDVAPLPGALRVAEYKRLLAAKALGLAHEVE